MPKLTDRLVQSVPAPAAGRTEIADAACAGLAFRVTRNGVRSWSFRFLDPVTRKDARITLGHYPDVTLRRARQLATGHRKAVADGSNPAAAKRKARADAERSTFAYLADRYMNEHARRRKRSHATDDSYLRLHILPHWRGRPYALIRRADAIELIEVLVTAGKPTLANRVHALISKVFNFAIDSDLLEANPCARLKRRGVERIGRRVLSDDEIRLFWPRIVEAPVTRPVGLALRLALLTGARVAEVAGIERGELHDADNPACALWIVPAVRSKNGLPHAVPLGPMARAIVVERLRDLEPGERFLFPSRRHADAPIRSAALSNVGRRFRGVVGDGAAADSWRADPPTPHDLRRTFATRMAMLGIPKELRDRLLNHAAAGSDTERRHYNVHDYLAEKRAALLRWDAALSLILKPAGAAVVPIGSRR